MFSSSLQKQSAGGYDMDERDFYVDDTQPSYAAVMATRTGRVAGSEYIVHDREDEETKCTLCRNILRDGAAVIDHLRAQKHVHAYFVCAPTCRDSVAV